MDYVCLGRAGLRVSPLCLGTMNFGPLTPETDSHAIMDEALELGINFLDTADVYGWKKGEGWTEQIIGRWLAQGGGRRERIVLATKVYGGMGPGPNDRGLSAYHIRRACEDSLSRMQTDHIDLYQMHHIDRRTPVEEFLQAMEQLTHEGKILYLGSSNFPAWQIARTQMAAGQRNFLGLVSEQCLYSLADRMVELEVLPAARAFGLGIMPWSPLSGGLLAGALERETSGRRGSDVVKKKLKAKRASVERWETLCRELGQPPERVALAWLLKNPIVTAPIIGPRTIEQLRDSLHVLPVTLDDDAWKKVEEIWPGPGGEAPEAYSW
ncbi:MAG: aldo/keto reductase [Planctomycetes bacterium]|nr:aldo/keto reductase [Planctomycetota bacterium]